MKVATSFLVALVCLVCSHAAAKSINSRRNYDEDPMMAMPSDGQHQAYEIQQQEVRYVTYQQPQQSQQQQQQYEYQPASQPQQEIVIEYQQPQQQQQTVTAPYQLIQVTSDSRSSSRPQSEQSTGPSKSLEPTGNNESATGEIVYSELENSQNSELAGVAQTLQQNTGLSATILTEVPIKDMPYDVLDKLKREYGIKVVATRERPGANLVINCEEHSANHESSICNKHPQPAPQMPVYNTMSQEPQHLYQGTGPSQYIEYSHGEEPQLQQQQQPQHPQAQLSHQQHQEAHQVEHEVEQHLQQQQQQQQQQRHQPQHRAQLLQLQQEIEAHVSQPQQGQETVYVSHEPAGQGLLQQDPQAHVYSHRGSVEVDQRRPYSSETSTNGHEEEHRQVTEEAQTTPGLLGDQQEHDYYRTGTATTAASSGEEQPSEPREPSEPSEGPATPEPVAEQPASGEHVDSDEQSAGQERPVDQAAVGFEEQQAKGAEGAYRSERS